MWNPCFSEGDREAHFVFTVCNHRDFLNICLIKFLPPVIAIKLLNQQHLNHFIVEQTPLRIISTSMSLVNGINYPLNFIDTRLHYLLEMNF